MTPLERSHRIIDLHAAIKIREARLQEFDKARTEALSVEVKISGRNSSGYPETILENKADVFEGLLVRSYRYCNRQAFRRTRSKKRLLEAELADLEAGFR